MTRELKVDHFVKTADGAVYQISYISQGHQTAELRPLEGGERLTLPLSELRRVADPKNKRPRIEGIPDGPRPRCPWCDRPLKPSVVNHYDNEPKIWRRTIVRRTFDGWSTRFGYFCTLGCAAAFGRASYKAGYRRTGARLGGGA